MTEKCIPVSNLSGWYKTESAVLERTKIELADRLARSTDPAASEFLAGRVQEAQRILTSFGEMLTKTSVDAPFTDHQSTI